MAQLPIRRSVAGLALLLLVGVSALPLQAQDDQEERAKEQAILQLLQVSGADAMGKEVILQLLNGYKQAHPNVPEDFWAEFKAEVDQSELTGLLVPVYRKHFSLTDLKALIEFYRSPAGRKLVRLQPTLAREASQVGMEWGDKLSRRVMKRLEEMGYR